MITNKRFHMTKIWPFVLFFLTAPTAAFARDVEVEDAAGVLGAEAVVHLQARAADWNFRLRVLTTNEAGDLDALAGARVSGPDVVSVVISPGRHKTYTHFGRDIGVPASDFDRIAKAGNSAFRSGAWADGLGTIGEQAAASASQHRTVATAAPEGRLTVGHVQMQPLAVQTPPPPSDFGALWFLLFVFALGAALGLSVYLYRRHQKKVDDELEDFRAEADQYRSRNIEEAAWHERMKAKMPAAPAVEVPSAPKVRMRVPPTLPDVAERNGLRLQQIPGPTPSVTILRESNSASDVFLGYEMERAAERIFERQAQQEETRRGRREEAAPKSSTSDSGSSSSSSFFDSSGSFDSGGGGGDFGGGGGFDGGGGGGDF